MSEIIAFCNKIEVKTGIGRNNKPYTVYNVQCTTKAGESKRLGWGFNAPSFREGQWFKTQTATNDRGYEEYAKGAPVEVKDGPAPAASSQDATPAGNSAGSGGGKKTSQEIHYQNSRTAAVAFLDILERADALPISTAKDKAGKAKRFEQLLAFKEKLEVQFFHDLETFRLLEKHADAGEVEVPEPAPLPEPEPEPEPAAEEQIDAFAEDIPF